jgi:hypothetical protein
MVGAPGFEPGASCAQGRRATRLRYAPTTASFHSTASCKFGSTAAPSPCAKNRSILAIGHSDSRW